MKAKDSCGEPYQPIQQGSYVRVDWIVLNDNQVNAKRVKKVTNRKKDDTTVKAADSNST